MNTTRTLCFVIAALSSYAALVYRLTQVRRSWRDGAYRALLVTLLLQCLTFTMGAVAMGGGAFLGVGNLAILLMHVAAVAFCVSAQVILLRWALAPEEAARRGRSWLIAGVAVNVLLVALFFLVDGPGRAATDFNTGSGQPLVLLYLLVFIVSQAVPCVTIFRQCGAYLRMADKESLRQALRMLSVTAAILFLYCSARTVNILTAAAGLDIGLWQLASNVFSAVGIVTLSLSLTISSWGPPATRLLEWARNYRAYRALYPLWRDLYEASPDIALEPPGAAVSDLDYRLHRRVVEIRDGWRELRPYIERVPVQAGAPAIEQVGPAVEEAGQAFTEAAQLRRALHAKRTGTVPVASKDEGDFEDRDTDNFTAEVAWLTQVASAYRRMSSAS
ncbi:MAB_1171c family putative transporter [Kitasatospora sp. NPDC002227]|uniref:MAB_1171c family putative transporter n=1 Tax=Kitasatospora sp. NPDC002227 TaxID=3154773 RepID=UPI00332C76A1